MKNDKEIKALANDIATNVEPEMFLHFISDAIMGAAKYEKNFPPGERGLIYFLIIHLNLIGIPFATDNPIGKDLPWAIGELVGTWSRSEYLERLAYAFRATTDQALAVGGSSGDEWQAGMDKCLDALFKIARLMPIAHAVLEEV